MERRVDSIDENEVRERMVRGARQAFASFGIRKATMGDIAKAAGISRSSLYNLGVSKAELADAAIVTRLGELGESSRSVAERDLSFGDSLVATFLQITEGARQDAELTRMLETTEAMHLHSLLTGPNPQVHAHTLHVFAPAFDRARIRGEMRLDISYDQAAHWLRFVLAALILHQGLEPASEEELVRRFVLPSLVEHDTAFGPSAADTSTTAN